MELYRNGLKLAATIGLDESRGSVNVPVKLSHNQKDEYLNYTEQIHIRYLFDNQVKEEILPTNDTGFYIPGKPLSHNGPIELAVHLINGNVELVTNELSFVVKNAPNGTTQVDPSEFTWQQLVDQYVNAKLDTFADKADMNKFKDDVNANLSNQDKKITDLQASTKSTLDSQNTKINDASSTQNSKIATLESRMDTFTNLKEGSTTGDAELQDIRVGADGTKYPSAGKAVREQVNQLKEDLDDLSIGNYIIRPNYRSGKIEPSTGEEVTPYDTARISEKLNFDNYESVNVRTTASEDPNKGAYFSVFEFDSSGKYIKQIVNTVHEYTITPTNGHLYVLQWWFGGTEFENRLPYTKVLAKSLLNKRDKEKIYADLSPKTKAKLDLPDKLFIVKGETLELFKYGMYYTDTEFINNQYNVRVVNIDEYTTQYDDKIVISCPKDYSKPILQGTNDFALFQLINTYGKVIEQQRVKIFVADKATISDIDRNIMYIGDSFTGMGFRTQEIANLIAKESNLTNTKLIGKFIGEGSGNRFTGTGGYSWANYTENPSTLPSAYPNNYLWDADNNQISMKYLVDSLGENHLEYVVILLGWNDYESGAFASSFDWDIMKQRAKRLIENIHNYYPNCKVILESYHYMYPLRRKSYGGALPQVRQNKYIYDLNRFYQKIANEYEYVEFVQMSIQIDVLHNMGFEEEKVNKRNEKIVKYCKDVVHPADIGFYQYSDAEFNALLYLMQ